MELGKKEKILASIILGCLVILFSIFILKNSIFYDYEKSFKEYLVNYPKTKDISKINNIIERYQNNELVTNNINKLVLENVEEWINNFNKDYESTSLLDSSYEDIKDVIKSYVTNTKDKVVINHEKEYYDLIERLYLSKTDYLTGLSSYENKDFEEAYTYFNKVIKIDSSFKLIPPLIDNCINNYLEKVYHEIDTILADLNDTNEKEILIKIINTLTNYENTSSIDLSISKSFNETKDKYLDELKNIYKEELTKLINENKYEEANIILSETYTYFEEDIFKEEQDMINNHLPVELIKLKPVDISGWWKVDESIILQKGSYKDMQSNVLTYNLNKEYQSLNFDIVSLNKLKKDNTSVYIKIYSDNKLIYTSDNITYNSNAIKCHLNVSNTMELKLEAYYNIDNKSDKSLFNFLELENGILEKS